jgi:peptidoglycan/xylan/chitin deacetylase (PgdA/CDA1 family)
MRNVVFILLLVHFFVVHGQDKKICITVDDLPAVTYSSNNGGLYRKITSKLINTFDKYNIPAIGFVVEGQLYKEGAVDSVKLELLEMWLENGCDLGNHTFSHYDYNNVSDTAYFNDILKGQILTKSLMQNHKKVLKFFRHPYLHSGADSIKSKSLNDFLSKNNYIISPVTIDNDDYLFAKAYHMAYENKDTSLMKAIGLEYVDYMEQKLHYFEKISEDVFNRKITQTLLIHASLINGDYFDELAKMYIKNGYTFISLEEAFNDPAYSTQITSFSKRGLSWLFRWGLSKGMDQKIMENDISVPQKIIEHANK